MACRLLSTATLFFAFICTYSAQIYGEEIVHWDFADGIPEDWTNESLSGIGHWEYRGPSTDPNISTCSRGSCGLQSVPPPTISLENGFAIFDSNYWDDDLGPCGAIGTGQDPGPHEAWLTTSSVDLSTFETLVLTFQQQYKHFNHADYDIYTFVEISVDDGDWTLIYENPGDQAVSDVVEWATVNITDLVAGSTNVKFRFAFTGFYYWWAIDDIVIYTPNEHDLLLEEPKYTLFDFNIPPDGFGDMEYNSYPTCMLPTFHFSGKTTNIGGQVQTDTKLQILIEEEELQFEVYSEESSSEDLSPGAIQTISLPNGFTPTDEIGEYGIEFFVTQNELDENLLNNFAQKDYCIDPHIFARDEDELEDVFIPNPIWENDTVQVGNLFHTWESGLQVHALSVALGDSTTLGTEVIGIVYDINRDTIYGQTEPHIVNSWDLNGEGENKFVCLPLIDPIITADTSLYLVMFSHEGGPDARMFVGRSGTPPNFASLVSYPESNQLFFLLKTPMVRMHLFPSDVLPGCTDNEALNFDPDADTDNGCCQYGGCTNESASNYNPDANIDDGSCEFVGCTDSTADNFDPNANIDDGSCEFWGCLDTQANNFDSTANVDDGSCVYNDAVMSVDFMSGCAPLVIIVNNQTDAVEEGICEFDLGDTTSHTGCESEFAHEYTSAGVYTITYTYTVGEFESQATVGPITVFTPPPTPTATYTLTGNILSCDCDEAEEIYWYYDGELLEEANGSNSINPEENGLYYVEIVDENGCSAISDEIVVIIQDVEDHLNDGLIKLYPNPTSNWAALVVPGSGFLVDFFNSSGHLVYSESHPSASTQVLRFDLAPGLYYVRIQTADHLETRQLLVR